MKLGLPILERYWPRSLNMMDICRYPPEMDWLSAGSTSADIPEGVTKINDSLYQLYPPTEGKPAAVDIVFFHGVRLEDYKDAYWKTWCVDDNETQMWPKTLLPAKFPEARILSVCYDSCVKETATTGRSSIDVIAEALLEDLIDGSGRVGRDCPVVLVGHSFGGLVIKMLVLEARKRQTLDNSEAIDSFLKNVKGLFYYATPHVGSRLADIRNKMPNGSPILPLLTTLNEHTARLNNEFREFREKHKIRAHGVAESWDTKILGFECLVVEEASARYDVDFHYTARADHVGVCKHKAPTCSSYQFFESFIMSLQ